MAVTVDGSDLAYYLDGSLVGSSPVGANALAKLSNDHVYLGQSVFPGDPHFIGSINEFSICDSALSGSQIAADFTAGPVPEPTTVALIGLGLGGLVALRRGRA